jgi:hypothetical protein
VIRGKGARHLYLGIGITRAAPSRIFAYSSISPHVGDQFNLAAVSLPQLRRQVKTPAVRPMTSRSAWCLSPLLKLPPVGPMSAVGAAADAARRSRRDFNRRSGALVCRFFCRRALRLEDDTGERSDAKNGAQAPRVRRVVRQSAPEVIKTATKIDTDARQERFALSLWGIHRPTAKRRHAPFYAHGPFDGVLVHRHCRLKASPNHKWGMAGWCGLTIAAAAEKPFTEIGRAPQNAGIGGNG